MCWIGKTHFRPEKHFFSKPCLGGVEGPKNTFWNKANFFNSSKITFKADKHFLKKFVHIVCWVRKPLFLKSLFKSCVEWKNTFQAWKHCFSKLCSGVKSPKNTFWKKENFLNSPKITFKAEKHFLKKFIYIVW